MCWPVLGEHCHHNGFTIVQGMRESEEAEYLDEWAKHLEEWATDCLKELGTECLEGEGRKTTLRVIKFRPGSRPVKVKEREV